MREACESLPEGLSRVYSLDVSSPGEGFTALQKKNQGKLEYVVRTDGCHVGRKCREGN